MQQDGKWYTRSAEEVLALWQTDRDNGLSTREVNNRLGKFGLNQISSESRVIWWQRFISQFQDFMVLILLGATLIAAFLGEYVDAATILAIVILNAILGFFQEYRAERSMQALKKLAAPASRVVRNGVVQQVKTSTLVPGDIIVLEAGDKLAADGRLVFIHNLEAEEAALTGESLPVRKVAAEKYSEASSLGDRKNMVYAGTSITRGRGKAVVCATGMATEIGRIANMMQSVEHEATPLEKRLEQLGRWLVWCCLVICLIVVVTGVLKGEPVFLMCMSGISLAVAAIPEGLPAIVTVALALGVQRMIKRKAIVRKLPAVETLGCITAICSDKTGTLTQNAMTVKQVYSGEKAVELTGAGYDIKGDFFVGQQEIDVKKNNILKQCLAAGVLCNNSILKRNNISITGLWRTGKSGWSIEGDPTEGALVVAAAKAGIWRENIEKTGRRIAEIPFEPERRRMSVVYHHQDNNKYMLYVKGAPDTVIGLCSSYQSPDGVRKLDPETVAKITAANDDMTSRALRVLAVASREIKPDELDHIDELMERDLVFSGLFGMIDPPRPEVRAAVATCRRAGIKTIMITGDHRNTAVAIAQQLQIFRPDQDRVLSGLELDQLSEDELIKVVNNTTVYARVSPAHKLRIVKALKKVGHIVAMTGDGVNDAPAVKEANIGIAMGMMGTDVTKEASAMILADDNFATIVAAVEEGRAIYDNIRKFIRYLLACNFGEVLTMFLAAVAGLPLPLLPVQILWVNLVTDGLPAMALGVDAKEKDLMDHPPRKPNESVFSRGLSRKIISRGIQIGACSVLVFAGIYYARNDLSLARTMAFSTLVFSQMFHVFDCRSEYKTIFEVGFMSNVFLIIAAVCSVTMQIAVIYQPFLSRIFQTSPLTAGDWIFVLLISGWTFIINTIRHIFTQERVPQSAFGRIQQRQ